MSYYPDTATFVNITGGGNNPDTGYPMPETENVVQLTGRYDAKISDFLKSVSNANSFVPVFVFYMPQNHENVPVGAILRVKDSSSGIEFTGKVQMFNKGKYNAFALCSNT